MSKLIVSSFMDSIYREFDMRRFSAAQLKIIYERNQRFLDAVLQGERVIRKGWSRQKSGSYNFLDGSQLPFTLKQNPNNATQYFVMGEELGRGGIGAVREVLGEMNYFSHDGSVKFTLVEGLVIKKFKPKYNKAVAYLYAQYHDIVKLDKDTSLYSQYFEAVEEQKDLSRLVFDYARKKYKSSMRKAFLMKKEEGQPLSRYLKAKRKNLPVCQMIKLARSILSSYKKLRDLGYIHRDIKPANIMVRPGGKASLVDLDMAMQLEKNKEYRKECKFEGTKGYSPPEVPLPISDESVYRYDQERVYSEQGDIYALGKTLGKMCGQLRDDVIASEHMKDLEVLIDWMQHENYQQRPLIDDVIIAFEAIKNNILMDYVCSDAAVSFSGKLKAAKIILSSEQLSPKMSFELCQKIKKVISKDIDVKFSPGIFREFFSRRAQFLDDKHLSNIEKMNRLAVFKKQRKFVRWLFKKSTKEATLPIKLIMVREFLNSFTDGDDQQLLQHPKFKNKIVKLFANDEGRLAGVRIDKPTLGSLSVSNYCNKLEDTYIDKKLQQVDQAVQNPRLAKLKLFSMLIVSVLTGLLPGFVFYITVKPSFKVAGELQAAKFLKDAELSKRDTPQNRKQTYLSVAGLFKERLENTGLFTTRARETKALYEEHAEILTANAARAA